MTKLLTFCRQRYRCILLNEYFLVWFQIPVRFLRIQSTASQHWFKWYLCTKQGQAIISTNGHLDCWHICINLFCCPFLDHQGATNFSTWPRQHCCGSVQNVVMLILFFLCVEVCIYHYQYNTYTLTYWGQDVISFERENIHLVKDKNPCPFIER